MSSSRIRRERTVLTNTFGAVHQFKCKKQLKAVEFGCEVSHHYQEKNEIWLDWFNNNFCILDELKRLNRLLDCDIQHYRELAGEHTITDTNFNHNGQTFNGPLEELNLQINYLLALKSTLESHIETVRVATDLYRKKQLLKL